jgi:hypothetical protein
MDDMDDKTQQEGGGGSQETGRDIQRIELLKRHFDAAEINRLITCQARYREGVDALDLSADLHRLRFARWLVEHGKLTDDVDEDVDRASDASDSAATDEPGQVPHASASLKYLPAPYWYTQRQPRRSPNHHSGGWRRALATLIVRLRRHPKIARSSVNARMSSSIPQSTG